MEAFDGLVIAWLVVFKKFVTMNSLPFGGRGGRGVVSMLSNLKTTLQKCFLGDVPLFHNTASYRLFTVANN